MKTDRRGAIGIGLKGLLGAGIAALAGKSALAQEVGAGKILVPTGKPLDRLPLSTMGMWPCTSYSISIAQMPPAGYRHVMWGPAEDVEFRVID